MKLSDLRPCMKCRGPIVNQGAAGFYRIRVNLVIPNPQAINGVAGLLQLWGIPIQKANAHELSVAETMAPHAENAFIEARDQDPSLETTFDLCQQCYLGIGGEVHEDLFPVAGLVEIANRQKDEQART